MPESGQDVALPAAAAPGGWAAIAHPLTAASPTAASSVWIVLAIMPISLPALSHVDRGGCTLQDGQPPFDAPRHLAPVHADAFFATKAEDALGIPCATSPHRLALSWGIRA